MTNKFRAMMESIGFVRSEAMMAWKHPKTNMIISDTEVEGLVNDTPPPLPSFVPLIPPPGSPVSQAETPFVYPDDHLLKARLNIRPVWDFPWKPTIIVRGSDVVSVIIGKGNGYVTVLEDDVNLFPSDTLVGKLRLLEP